MSKIEIQILDYTNGVLGTLDITDSQNFPLVLSYLVSDARDIETKFGDFSKSFDVPATKNNNKLFNNIYNAQIDDDKSITDLKDCRILVDTQEFFKGKIQVKGNKQSSRPLSYNCTVFGGNYGWLSKIKDLYLCDLYADTDTFTYTPINIAATWDSNQSVSPIVFPVIDYGALQIGTGALGLNLLGTSSPVSTVNDNPKDWRPSFYIYNLLHKIADNVGYTIESNFLEDADFKKLISHFPPNLGNKALSQQSSHTRQNWNQTSGQSDKAIWDSNVTSRDIQILVASNAKTINTSGVDTGFQRLKFNSVISDENSVYNSSTGEFTSQESGYYDFENTAHLVIGNFDDDQSTVQGVAAKINVKLRIRKYDASNATTTTIFETSNDNSKVGGYNFKNYIGSGNTYASYSYNSSSVVSIPLINCVKINAKKENVFLATGDKIYVDASVKCYSNAVASNVRWGVVNLQDKDQKSYAGSFTNLRIQGVSNDSFYDANNTDNIANIWESNEIPFSRLQKSSIDNPDYAWDETYTFNELLPCNVRQLDFIKGVAHMFNLQFRTDPVLNKIYIEPYNDFYKDKSLAYDWTNKLDLSKEIEDKYQVGLTQEISFEYKNDTSDGLMSYINRQFRDASSEYHFYNYYENLGDNFRKGITKFVNPLFSSTWNDWNGALNGAFSSSGIFTPAINGEESLYGPFQNDLQGHSYQRPPKIFKYNPRILYYDGFLRSPNQANLGTKYVISLDSAVTTPISLSVFPSQQSRYARATFVDWEDISFSNKFANLSYDDEDVQPPLDSSAVVTKLGLYNTYYKKMIDQLKANPRIRVMHFNLKKSDMINLDLSRLIYVDGTYWRINKIIDYSPIKNVTTKVECVQWIEKS